jgi:carbonic anhydrase
MHAHSRRSIARPAPGLRPTCGNACSGTTQQQQQPHKSEGDPAAEKLLSQATSRKFVSCRKCAPSPSQFHAFRGALEALDAPRSDQQMERLAWDVRRGMSSILNHPWIPTTGPDAVTVRGFVYDVDTGKLEEVSYPGAMGSIG